MVDPKVQELIQVVIEQKGADETWEEIEEFYEVVHKGAKETQKDADETTPKLEKFLGRWKTDMVLLGGTAAAFFGVMKYSTVAASQTEMVGSSLGVLIDSVLLPAMPVIENISLLLLGMSDVFTSLPDPIQVVISTIVLITGVLGVLMKLGVVEWFLGTAYGAKIAATAAGIFSSAIVYLGAVLAGLALGAFIVTLLEASGVLQNLSDYTEDWRLANANLLAEWNSGSNILMSSYQGFLDIFNEIFELIGSNSRILTTSGINDILAGGAYNEEVMARLKEKYGSGISYGYDTASGGMGYLTAEGKRILNFNDTSNSSSSSNSININNLTINSNASSMNSLQNDISRQMGYQSRMTKT